MKRTISSPLVPVRRLPVRINPEPRRTIVRVFWPGAERAERICRRIVALSDERVARQLSRVHARMLVCHPDVEEILGRNYQELATRLPGVNFASDNARLLAGAYFSMEYAFESAALFNPSMVPALEQSGVSQGRVRFLMSLRAVGEGHLSSIAFRRGYITADGEIELATPSLQARQARMQEQAVYTKSMVQTRLTYMNKLYPGTRALLTALPEAFNYEQLCSVVAEARTHREPEWVTAEQLSSDAVDAAAKLIMWIVRSNYHIHVPADTDVSELVLFPISEAESQGMEDMRLARFTDNDGSERLFGTYTAFSGNKILPQMLEVRPPSPSQAMKAQVHTLGGRYAQNKGLALFPRPVGGKYRMLGRFDGENQYLLTSDRLDFWDQGVRIQEPRWSWEFVQVGNCGSPIETDAGWLVLTHGVGPMRRYCVGAILLDRDDPTRLIGQLPEPLLEPTEDESSGYVPNVVYSCGAMMHNGHLVIPYGISDMESGFAIVELEQLLQAMR